MLMSRPIRDGSNHEPQHVSDSENDQGPTPDNHPRQPVDGRCNWHRDRLLDAGLGSTVQKGLPSTKGDTSRTARWWYPSDGSDGTNSNRRTAATLAEDLGGEGFGT